MSVARLMTAAPIGAALVLAGCDLGPKAVTQTGYRGTGMAQVTDVSDIREEAAIPADPYALPADTGPRAREVYQNVQVLGDLSAERFNHLMAQITQWVAPPEQGCNYCHNPANLASDEVYQKVVARQMIRMTWDVNSQWASHVQATGVTCWTCHRGNGVPQYNWAMMETDDPGSRNNRMGQNQPNANVGYASLPGDPFSLFAQGEYSSRVAGKQIYPAASGNKSVKDAEANYAYMMHLSSSLGVNCTFCHNTQSLGAWNLSRAQRATAYYGIRMVADINDTHITPLTPVFPANRKGPMGDPYKINCMTCHQGLNKPLAGVSMLARAPTLRGPVGAVATAEDVGGAAARAATARQFDAPAAVNTGPAQAPPANSPAAQPATTR
ncbi:photosynthetic reaction center cytochrome PufC [Sphingomonas baiyangensis]|uniref:Photosynthetic reaction center cytochrome c subunit n=1 Tax=Sphingomonas baiyangensis TaxID=2572576 RepID=A0A4U1L248_9SPHN|nr:photosynthetic reaction center cytochrome PufC [Sphingomonas baiyangensis]TKD50947.1 photosynthetic reaction center cytochrome c subunit [Sphingomonas baiyangensis]